MAHEVQEVTGKPRSPSSVRWWLVLVVVVAVIIGVCVVIYSRQSGRHVFVERDGTVSLAPAEFASLGLNLVDLIKMHDDIRLVSTEDTCSITVRPGSARFGEICDALNRPFKSYECRRVIGEIVAVWPKRITVIQDSKPIMHILGAGFVTVRRADGRYELCRTNKDFYSDIRAIVASRLSGPNGAD